MKSIIFLFTVIILLGCKKTDTQQNTNNCDPLISYSNKVKSIFVTNCSAAGCHDGVDLPSLTEYLVARDASQQIRTAVKNGVMPRNSILSVSDKAAIICWIDNGSKNN
jgi:hypothetical protein